MESGGAWSQFTSVQRWAFLGVLFLVGTSSSMDRGIIAIVLQKLKVEFQLSDSMLGVLGGAPFGICYAVSSVPLARLADRVGRKIVLFGACLAWSLMTAACGLATTLPFLILARMGVGFAEGGSIAPCHALIAEYFPPARRGVAFAAYTASGTLGLLTASAVGGWLAQHYGWRSAFFGMALLSAPIALLILGVLREPVSPRQIHTKSRDFWSDLRTLLKKRSFTAVLAGLFFFSSMPFGVIIFTPTYMVRALGLDLALAGKLFGLATAVGTIIGSLAGGYLSDFLRRRDERWLLRMPGLILIVDVPVAVAAYSSEQVNMFLVLHAANTALLYAVLPSIFATVQHLCGGARRATATAAVFVVLNAIGVSLAPLATGMLSDLFSGPSPASSLRYALISMSCSLVPAALILLFGSQYVAAERED